MRWAMLRMVSQPVATFAQPLRLSNPAGPKVPRAYVLCAQGKEDQALPDLGQMRESCGGEIDPNAPLPTHRNEEREVTFVTAEDLHDWMDAGHENEVVFIDNRNLFTFEQQRIAGARLIPTDDVELSLGSLPLNKWSVFYCT